MHARRRPGDSYRFPFRRAAVVRAKDGATTLTPPFQRTASLLALAFVGVVLAWPYAVYLRAPAIGTFHDDGVYLVTAKALATGQGYRIISLPGQPAQTKYPFLFPWLLSLAWRAYSAFPQNLPWLRLVPFTAGIAWLYLSWRVLRRLGATAAVAAAAIALTAASPWTVFLSTTLLSETLFAALVAGGLLFLARIEHNTERRYDAIVAGAIMGAAFLARTAAIAAAMGGLLVLASRKRWRAAAQYSASVLIVAAPWIWWTARHASDPIVDPFYSASNYASWNIVFNYAWADKLAVLVVNTLWAIQVGQYWGLNPGSTIAWIVAAVCVPCIIRGLWLQRHSSIALATVLYIGLVLRLGISTRAISGSDSSVSRLVPVRRSRSVEAGDNGSRLSAHRHIVGCHVASGRSNQSPRWHVVHRRRCRRLARHQRFVSLDRRERSRGCRSDCDARPNVLSVHRPCRPSSGLDGPAAALLQREGNPRRH